MDEFIATFHIDWKLMLAQTVNFGLVLMVFYLLAAKPLSKLMKERTQDIKKGLLDAKKNAELLKNTKAEYENTLTQAHLKANSIFEEGKKQAKQKKEEMINTAKKEVTLMIANGKKNLEVEKIKIIDEAKEELISLIVKTTEKIIDTKVDKSLNEKIIKELNSL
jgi:F-type H+-transporting ATPase subunit b